MKKSTKNLIDALHDLVSETAKTLSAAPLDTLDVNEISQTVANLDVIQSLVDVIANNEEIYYS